MCHISAVWISDDTLHTLQRSPNPMRECTSYLTSLLHLILRKSSAICFSAGNSREPRGSIVSQMKQVSVHWGSMHNTTQWNWCPNAPLASLLHQILRKTSTLFFLTGNSLEPRGSIANDTLDLTDDAHWTWCSNAPLSPLLHLLFMKGLNSKSPPFLWNK